MRFLHYTWIDIIVALVAFCVPPNQNARAQRLPCILFIFINTQTIPIILYSHTKTICNYYYFIIIVEKPFFGWKSIFPYICPRWAVFNEHLRRSLFKIPFTSSSTEIEMPVYVHTFKRMAIFSIINDTFLVCAKKFLGDAKIILIISIMLYPIRLLILHTWFTQ